MKRNLSSQAIRAMAIGMAVTLGSATAVSGVVTGTVVNVYAANEQVDTAKATITKENTDVKITLVAKTGTFKSTNASTNKTLGFKLTDGASATFTGSKDVGSITIKQTNKSNDTLEIVIPTQKLTEASFKLDGSETFKLTYAKTNTSDVQISDSGDTDLALTDLVLTGNVDTVAPTLQGASAVYKSSGSSYTVEVTLTENLQNLGEQSDQNKFTINKKGSTGTDNVKVTKYKFADDKLVLTLDKALKDDIYEIQYVQKDSQLKDAFNNELELNSKVNVTVSSKPVDSIAPTIETAAAYDKDSKIITLTASENLATLNTIQNSNNFEVAKTSTNGSKTITVNEFKVGDGNAPSKDLKLTINETSLEDGEYKVNYKTEKAEIKDEAGNKLAIKDNIATFVVAEGQKTITSSLNDNKTKVTLTTTGNLTKEGTPNASEFKANGNAATDVSVDTAKKTITLTFSSALQGNEKLSYDPADSGNSVKVDNKVLFLKDLAVNSVAAKFEIKSGTVTNEKPNEITLQFSENIKVADKSQQPAPTDFTVKVNGQNNVVKTLSTIDANANSDTLTLTLTTPVEKDQEVKLTYTKSTIGILNGSGNELSEIQEGSAINITNNVGSDAQPPVEEEKFDVTTTNGTYNFEKSSDNTVTLKGFKSTIGPIFRASAESTFENGILTTSQSSYYLTKIGNGTDALTELTDEDLKGQTAYVNEVANKAFENNTKITELSLPNVNKVGDNAFNGANKLATLELGTNETEIIIGNDAFKTNSALTNVKTNEAIKTSVEEAAKKGNNSATATGVVRKSVITANGSYTFEDLKDQGDLGTATLVAFNPMDTTVSGNNKVENGVATIDNKSYAITKIGNGTDSMSIPESFEKFNDQTVNVTEVATNAFKGTIPNVLYLPVINTIGENAFSVDSNLEEFTVLLEKSTTDDINTKAFGDTVKGTHGKVVFPFGTKLNNFKFDNTNVTATVNPFLYIETTTDGRKYEYEFKLIKDSDIALHSFADTTNGSVSKSNKFENEMQKFAAENPIVINEKARDNIVVFENGVITLDGQKFTLTQMGDGQNPVGSAMIDKEIGEHMVTVIDVKDNAFKGASKLTSLSLPKVRTIGSNAFENCSGLTTLTLGTDHSEKITMDKTALTGCKGLTKVETNDASKDVVKDAVKESGSDAPVNGEKPSDGGSGGSGSGGSGSGGGSSSGGSGGGSGANIGTITNKESNTEGSTEETTSQGNNNNETVVENKQLGFDVIKLPSVEGEAKVFGDVSANHWAKSYIDKLSTAGIINGSNGMFNPNGQTKRADVTVMLVNLLGLTPEANNKFADVNASAYYAPYVGTASTYGIVNGSNGMFNPQGVISRQDTMVMIAQILKGLNLNVNADTTALSQFGDASKVSAYANESVAILVNSGIISGNNGKLNPTAPVTRAEMATIMSKLYDVLASANK